MWEKVLAGALVAWAWIQIWWTRVAPIIEPIVEEAEQLALDGTIDLEDRKKLVMDTITRLEKEGKIKVGFITKILISKIVDIIARRLPDFIITKEIKDVMKDEIK